jgi:Domain of unknown function (DUF4337)
MNNLNELDKELSELKGFITDLKADRAAQKEKERREAWTKYTSMSLVFIAVLAAISTQRSGAYSSGVLKELNQSTFYQAQASDQWSYYQAKSIKQNLYESLRELAPKTAEGTNGAPSLELFNKKIAKYDADKAEITKEAKKLEQLRDTARATADNASRHGSGMGMAVSIFQIAIALGSICLVTKKKSLWYLSLAMAAGAAAQMLHVWLS